MYVFIPHNNEPDMKKSCEQFCTLDVLNRRA